MLQQLGKMISIVKQHIRNYLDEIAALIKVTMKDIWLSKLNILFLKLWAVRLRELLGDFIVLYNWLSGHAIQVRIPTVLVCHLWKNLCFLLFHHSNYYRNMYPTCFSSSHSASSPLLAKLSACTYATLWQIFHVLIFFRNIGQWTVQWHCKAQLFCWLNSLLLHLEEISR